ncbi:MAG: UDP-N-acetylmuramoyl-tripeptide--D-alanyl-D-alanine ligase [Bacteroidia bacterium]|nr:UDP-N-acetylmuramoyl-tripeptide--D-alanyl-D-alanine ligase [Bacteroidia bacterium]
MLHTEQLYNYFLHHPTISTDTRHLPEGCIFFALKGPSFNGNRFALQALEKGAAYAVVDEEAGDDPRLLRVEDALKSLQDLATYHRHRLDINILAITGSNGKTTTKELTAAVLKKEFETHYTQGNLNNHIGVPLTLLQLNDEHDFAVVEMGANHQREIAALCEIAQPDFGLITNIGKAHLEGFGGIEGVKKGKGELYAHLRNHGGLIFIQLDRPALRDLLHGYDNIISYGESAAVQYQGRVCESSHEFLEVEVLRPFHLRIRTQLTGDYNLDNVMAAVAVGSQFGVEAHDIKEAIEHYVPGNQRSQISRKGNLLIVEDTYNANPSSMKAALENFRRNFKGYKIIALGEMLELGQGAAEEHLLIARQAQAIENATLLLVGPLFEEAARELSCLHFPDSPACAAWLRTHLPEEGALLVKGSRGSKMEKVLDVFQEA